MTRSASKKRDMMASEQNIVSGTSGFRVNFLFLKRLNLSAVAAGVGEHQAWELLPPPTFRVMQWEVGKCSFDVNGG